MSGGVAGIGADRQAEVEEDSGWMNACNHRQMDSRLDGHRWDGGKEGWKDNEWEWCWVDGWLFEWLWRWMDGWMMNGWTDR